MWLLRPTGVLFGGQQAIEAQFVGTAPWAGGEAGVGPDNLQPIPVGTSSDLIVGQSVYATGNPFGLSRSLTTGIITALDRRVPPPPGEKWQA